MRVLFISNNYPNQAQPTRGTFNHSLITAIAKHCDIQVISPLPFWSFLRRPKELFGLRVESQTGFKTALPLYWSVPRLAGLHGKGMYASLKPLLQKTHREFPFDAIFVAWGYPDAYAAVRFAKDFHCPVVVRTMGSDIKVIGQRAEIRPQLAQTLQGADAVISVSRDLHQEALALGVSPGKAFVFHNGVNGTVFNLRDKASAREQLGLSPHRKSVLYIGNQVPVKGVDLLVDAVLEDEFDDIDLHLVGSGELQESLQKARDSRQRQSRIFFHGRKPHAEIPVWMSACDVFCLPSRSEGCPNVVLEALASGRPVVAAGVGGVPELLDKDNGIVVAPESPAALAQGLQEAFRRTWDPAALRASVEFLSWQEVGDAYFKVIADAVKTHS